MTVAVRDGAAPLGLAFWFALLASAALLVWLLLRGQPIGFDRRLLSLCVPWGILSVILPNVLFFYAAREVPAGVIALCIALVPTFTLVGAVTLRRERLSTQRSLGIFVGAAGIAMILIPESALPDPNDALFVLLALIGASCYAVEHLYIETRVPTSLGVDRLLFVVFASSTAILLPVVIVTDTFVAPTAVTTSTQLAIAGVAAVTLVDYVLITSLIQWAGPVFTSQAAYLVTFSGFLWGIALFGETPTRWLWAALAALLIGVSQVRPRESRREVSHKSPTQNQNQPR